MEGWQFSRYQKCQKLVDQNCTVLPSFPAGVMEMGPSTVQGHFNKPGSQYRAQQEHQAYKAYVQYSGCLNQEVKSTRIEDVSRERQKYGAMLLYDPLYKGDECKQLGQGLAARQIPAHKGASHLA